MLKLGNDWDQFLAEQYSQKYFKQLRHFLRSEFKTEQVYPSAENVFLSLKLTEFKATKVVIIGQDPYHGKNQAHGLAFSVPPGVAIPPSLRNIFRELESDLSCFYPNNGYLVPWAKQGVLLLNTIFTVRAEQPRSHHGKGWEIFTDQIISLLNQKKTPLVFMLWGNDAKMKAKLITNPQHLILTSAHPSPLAASRGFFGCRHFSQANQKLLSHGMEAINWQIPHLNTN